jgi:hypothetical protein
LTSCKIALHAAYCYIRLADYKRAEREARDALAVEAWSPGAADITRLELGIALAHRGSPDEAAEHGRQALARPRWLGGLLPRARELDAVLCCMTVAPCRPTTLSPAAALACSIALATPSVTNRYTDG